MSPGARLREIVDGREAVRGCFCMLPGAVITEILGAAGTDFVILDGQHGWLAYADIVAMLQAAAIRGTPAIVRTASSDAAEVGRMLDAGADGVLVPLVNTAEDARSALRAVRYPPDGERSWGPTRHVLADPSYGPRHANATAVCLAMIETVAAVDNLDAILDEGIDGVIVGPSDLAISHTGEVAGAASGERDPELIARVAETCARRAVACGFAGLNPADVPRWERAGYTLNTVTWDVGLLAEGMRRALAVSPPAPE
jgi:4-hydroxy-2-oxoheptanedioate aldolase